MKTHSFRNPVSLTTYIAQYEKENIKNVVYIWGFLNENKFFPYYIGQTEKFRSRVQTHIINLCGGAYNIFPLQDIFKKNSSARPLYSPDNLNNFITLFYDKKAQQETKEMINKFHITWTESSIEGGKQERENIETATTKIIKEKNYIIISGGRNISETPVNINFSNILL